MSHCCENGAGEGDGRERGDIQTMEYWTELNQVSKESNSADDESLTDSLWCKLIRLTCQPLLFSSKWEAWKINMQSNDS
ncbi:hypothetical protein T07_4981 [Trichinella nelsoni]|uniref:Uncharacterized protein n=1 Tax=Trichinella nelsoni TaxID=6336 RepID=A0A0V0RWU4_9BILA|nr:hypothetical protein T07_4981 [Trichinella nelsoni]